MILALTFAILAIIGVLAYASMNRKEYSGFSSTARRKAWNGELSKSDISDMEKSIIANEKEYTKNDQVS